MKISIAAASTAVAAIALVLSGAAPAAAKATTVTRQKAGAKLDCTSLPDCRQVIRDAKKDCSRFQTKNLSLMRNKCCGITEETPFKPALEKGRFERLVLASKPIATTRTATA